MRQAGRQAGRRWRLPPPCSSSSSSSSSRSQRTGERLGPARRCALCMAEPWGLRFPASQFKTVPLHRQGQQSEVWWRTNGGGRCGRGGRAERTVAKQCESGRGMGWATENGCPGQASPQGTTVRAGSAVLCGMKAQAVGAGQCCRRARNRGVSLWPEWCAERGPKNRRGGDSSLAPSQGGARRVRRKSSVLIKKGKQMGRVRVTA